MSIRSTYEQVRAANGPAQHIACAIWGVVSAGMLSGMVHGSLLCIWATLSVLILVSVVWLSPSFLKYFLLADFFTSMAVLSEYVMYKPPMQPIYYVSTATGMHMSSRSAHAHDDASMWAHSLAIITLCVWSLYLANLVHRQILERKRFLDDGR